MQFDAMYAQGKKLHMEADYSRALARFNECAKMVELDTHVLIDARNTDHYIRQCRAAMMTAETEKLRAAAGAAAAAAAAAAASTATQAPEPEPEPDAEPEPERPEDRVLFRCCSSPRSQR